MARSKNLKAVQYNAGHGLEALWRPKNGPVERTATFDYTPFVGKNGAPIEELVKKVETVLECDSGKTVIITSIGKVQGEGLVDAFEAAGLKLKFEWSAESREARTWMADKLHSTPVAVWLSKELPHLEQQVEDACECGKQQLWPAADSKQLYEDGSSFHPDQTFTIQEGPAHCGYTRTAVAIESLNSQTLRDGQEKARKIIWRSAAGIRAVILLNFENQPRAGDTKARCRVTIEIWRRQKTGDQAIDYPLDSCPWKDDEGLSDEWASQVKEPTPERDATDRPSNKSSSSEEADDDRSGDYKPNEDSDDGDWAEGPTLVETSPPAPAASPPPSPPPPYVPFKPESTFLVLDEDNVNGEVEADFLPLQVYDFLRVCALDPNKRIPLENQEIRVRLRWLRQAITACLRDLRRDLGIKIPRKRPAPNGQVGDGNTASVQPSPTKRQRADGGQKPGE